MAKLTISDIQQMKTDGKKGVTWVVYSYEMARIIDKAEPDMLLVGDSGSGFLLGHPDANDTTVDDMIVMGRAVRRASQHAPVIVDMPFMSYQVSIEEAVRNAGRIFKETHCDGVKLEGGADFAPTVAALVRVGIPVMAHMGITPMLSAATGGMRGARRCLKIGSGATPGRSRRQAPSPSSSRASGRRSPRLLPKSCAYPRSQATSLATSATSCLGFPPRLGYAMGQVDNPTAAYGSVGKAIYDSAAAYIADARGQAQDGGSGRLGLRVAPHVRGALQNREPGDRHDDTQRILGVAG